MSFRVVWGPSCSGKSTYVREHKSDTAVVWDYDRVSAALTCDTEHTRGGRDYAHKFVLDARSAFINTAKAGEHGATDIWFIMTNLNDGVRAWLEPLDPEYILMDVTEEECLARLEKDETRPDKEAWAAVISEWFKTHSSTKEDETVTPAEKRKFRDERQIRALQTFIQPTTKRIDSNYYVEGYAARFEPYVLYEDESGPIYERFEPGCFAGCDMSDIIFQLNHQGTVMARQSNGSLIVEADDVGLFTAADLGRTEAARNLYEEISTGMITKMSWGFILGDYHYDRDTRTIVHKSVRKIFDVSAVSVPANNNTEINARSWADGVIDLAARSEAALDERRRRLRLKLKTI